MKTFDTTTHPADEPTAVIEITPSNIIDITDLSDAAFDALLDTAAAGLGFEAAVAAAKAAKS